MAAEEALLKRVLPQNMEAEQAVVGSMIMDKEAISVASEMLTGDDFYSKQYGVVFDTMVELNDQGKAGRSGYTAGQAESEGCPSRDGES